MVIGVPRELEDDENRVPLDPQSAGKLTDLGAKLRIETGMGLPSGFRDEDYSSADVVDDRHSLLASSDIVLRLGKPPVEEVPLLKKGCIHISFLDPFRSRDVVEALAQSGHAAICMEMIPRTTLAQKYDALSSQASLAGYVAVVLAAEKLDKVFPMMMTPAGTISPSRVFIIGAGVAGLQAIATAKRLGARVEAFDTRPAVSEQVRSLGARFVEVDLGETGETTGGYARSLTEEQLARQRDAMASRCIQSDVVITTAQVFGRKAPVIINRDIIDSMKAGSIVVDMAVETGGNVEGSELGREVDIGGVSIIGYPNLAGRVPVHASQVYASNVTGLIADFWDKDTASLVLDEEDEIIKGCLITRDGEIVNGSLREAYGI